MKKMTALIVLAMLWTLAAFIVGWWLLGLKTGFAVALMIYGYTAFSTQMEAVVAGVRKIRRLR